MASASSERQLVFRVLVNKFALFSEDTSSLTVIWRETINRTIWEISYVLLLLGNALVLVGVLGHSLVGILLFHDAR
jgi:hypothetical protein